MFKLLISLAFGAIAALVCDSCFSQTIGVHLFSEHGHDTYQITDEYGPYAERKFNEKNFGAYIIAGHVDLFGVPVSPIVGAYKNSYYHTTVYGGLTYDAPLVGNWLHWGATAALATGYQRVHGVGILRPTLMPHLIVRLPGELAVRYSITPAKGGVFQHVSIERGL